MVNTVESFAKSRRTTAVSFFLSMAFRISSVVCMTDVSVECHCLFPLQDTRNIEIKLLRVFFFLRTCLDTSNVSFSY